MLHVDEVFGYDESVIADQCSTRGAHSFLAVLG